MPLVFHQALDARGGFLIIGQLQWCTFSADLQINAASHHLAMCFLHKLHPKFKSKFK
jgi:hypothetical protein